MAGFNFDEAEQFIQYDNDKSNNKINFLKLADDGYYAQVRFMYGPGETFQGQTVHNISEETNRQKFVPCLRGLGDPLEACPLCEAGSKLAVQYYIPLYVISITSNIRGAEQTQPVGAVMLFQRGSTFTSAMKSVVRQANMVQKPIVSCVFNLVRNGKPNDVKTNYTIELIGHDDITLEQLPPKPQIVGSYILPTLTKEEMAEKYVKKTAQSKPADIQPRTLSANTFAGNTVVGGSTFTPAPQPTNTGFTPMNPNQISPQAPNIGSGRTAF